MYDPKTSKYTAYQTCFGSHHLQFGYDANETLWMSTGGGGGNVGWINTKMLDETGDIEKSQGWTRAGARHQRQRPARRVHRARQAASIRGKDRRIGADLLRGDAEPDRRLDLGHACAAIPARSCASIPAKNPHTALAEIYNVPMPGFGPRGGDIDKQGLVWVSLASGHMGVFDRRQCKGPLNGPKATGNHCPEGWAFHQYPGPGFKGIGENSAEFELLLVGRPAQHVRARRRHPDVDRQPDGRPGRANKDGKMVSIRVPYPLGFYAKGFDGRIDDPNAGWKGRGLWAANGDRTPWLIEGGKGTKPLAAHFQLRPDPLAK